METKYMAGDTDLKPNTFTYNAVSPLGRRLVVALISVTSAFSLFPRFHSISGYQRSREERRTRSCCKSRASFA